VKETSLKDHLRPAAVLLGALTLLTGFAYPLLFTAFARAVFPGPANGSLILVDGRVRGSRLIGQAFTDPRHFWGRLSATSPVPCNAASSSGSNLAPTNRALVETAQARIDALRAADPANPAPIPVDLVTASGSGLDPDLSPAGAEYQVARVARARGKDESLVRRLVAENTDGRQLGVLGEPRVHILPLNLALDALP
jgi:potassium-transporting ATPase KdpC subunit